MYTQTHVYEKVNQMFFKDYPKYKNLPVIPVQTRRGGKNVLDELAKEGLDLFDVAEILENGYKTHRKRRKDVIERCINKGNKTIEVVVQKSFCFEEEVWEIIHAGSFTKKKR